MPTLNKQQLIVFKQLKMLTRTLLHGLWLI